MLLAKGHQFWNAPTFAVLWPFECTVTAVPENDFCTSDVIYQDFYGNISLFLQLLDKL